MKQNVKATLIIIFLLILNYLISEYFYHRLIYNDGCKGNVDIAFSYITGILTTVMLCILFFFTKLFLSFLYEK